MRVNFVALALKFDRRFKNNKNNTISVLYVTKLVVYLRVEIAL